MYADYNFYAGCYSAGREPTVPPESFVFWERQAEIEIDRYTFGRMRGSESTPCEVMECTCALAELLYTAETVNAQAVHNGGGVLASFSNDGQSGTYDFSQSVYTEKGKQSKVREIIYRYLGGTGLLYAGV